MKPWPRAVELLSCLGQLLGDKKGTSSYIKHGQDRQKLTLQKNVAYMTEIG